MTVHKPIPRHGDLAGLAARLVADRLRSASDPQAFRAALDDMSRLWSGLAVVAERRGWPCLAGRAAFALEVCSRGGLGTSDHDIETLIDFTDDVAGNIRSGSDCDPWIGHLFIGLAEGVPDAWSGAA